MDYKLIIRKYYALYRDRLRSSFKVIYNPIKSEIPVLMLKCDIIWIHLIMTDMLDGERPWINASMDMRSMMGLIIDRVLKKIDMVLSAATV